MLSPRTQLAWLSLAMFLGMTLWFSATAANAAIVAEFRLTAAETAWLTMAVQGGFVIGTLVSALLNLPDVLNPRRLFWIGCVAGAVANAWLAAAADWLAMAIHGGFLIGTLVSALLTLPDVLCPWRLFWIGCVAGAVATGWLAAAGGVAVLVTLRFVTGAALAMVYPPGMKVAA